MKTLGSYVVLFGSEESICACGILAPTVSSQGRAAVFSMRQRASGKETRIFAFKQHRILNTKKKLSSLPPDD